MACQLYTQDDLTALYSVVYGEILDRINDPSLGKFDEAAFNNLIKTIYEELKDNPDNAIIYAQAVPDIFNLVANDPEIKRYLVKEVGFNFNYPNEKSLDFEDLEVVKQFVSPKTETFDDVEKNLKQVFQNKENIEVRDDSELNDTELEARNGAKIEYPNRTSFQSKKSEDPTTFKKGDNRNKDDKRKVVFSRVQKNIVAAITFRSIDETDVIYQGVPLILSATRSSDFPRELKLPEHVIAQNDESVGVFAVVTDKDGNYIYFDQQGNITDDKENGTVVYTFLRKVIVDKGVLTLVYNRRFKENGEEVKYTYRNTLVDAKVLAEREANILAKQNNAELDNAWVDMRTQEIYEEQTKLMNGLFNLRNQVETSDEPVKLNITGGTLGIAREAFPRPITELGISEEELSTFDIITDEFDSKTGKGIITININTALGKIPQVINLQRGDFDEALADKVATVLTTKAKLKNKELNNKQRQDFFEVFINNKPKDFSKMNNDNIVVKTIDGELVVTLETPEGETIELKGDDLYNDKAKQIIKSHLKRKMIGQTGRDIPASIHYNKPVKELGYFIDYTIENDTITQSTKNYIEFLKPYAKASFSKEYQEFVYGVNPYLTFEIPAEFTEDIQYAIDPIEGDVVTAPKETIEEKYTKEVEAPIEKSVPEAFEEDLQTYSDDTIDAVDLSDYDGLEEFDNDEFERNKRLNNFLDRLFTTAEDKQRAEEWWANSPLSKYITLERIAQIVNSNAFATFSNKGITLYEGDGGTAVDLYHEAWHGFSQLFLTKDEKIKLYKELKAQPKWANMSFFEIEEEIAEDFRDYAKSKGKKAAPKGFLGKVFQRIYNFLNKLFGKATKEQVLTRPRDIASVKELFDKLYDASNRPELLQNMQPSLSNRLFTTKLNRAKVVKPLREYASAYPEFTESESLKAANLIDSILPKIFMSYSKAKENSAGPLKVLYNPNNRVAMYNTVNKRLKTIFENLKKEAVDYVVRGEDVPDYILSNQVFIEKIITNFGDPLLSVEGKQKTGIVAYHLENSRFKILSNTYTEIDNDPTNLDDSQMFKLDGGRTISSKDEASEATKTILSSIYKVDRSKFSTETVDGVTKFNIEYELNEFGEPILIDYGVMWNKLAKILAGSFDKSEMYRRLSNAIVSEPEIKQLLSMLPDPTLTNYKDITEFNVEVNFWQDLKKPRIAYTQLNVNAKPIKKNEAVYDTTVGTADFDTTAAIRDWNFEFVMSDPTKNKFLIFDEATSRYILDTKKIFDTFTDKKGDFRHELAKDFLNAIGIRLDYTNAAIKKETDDPKFGRNYGVDHIFNSIRATVLSSNTDGRFLRANPIKYIMEGVVKNSDISDKLTVSNTRIKKLAKLQTANSDKYSNFSALSPEGNRVWEHFLDSSITRIITSINHASSWQELTRTDADPHNKFQHMRWLSEDINTYSLYSQLLGSVFDLKNKKRPDGKRLNNSLLINNVAGTQLIEERKGIQDKKSGVSTASMDATSKFLQEFHTMLMNGVEEFMRHASKQMAQGLTVSGKINTGTVKKDGKLYVDIKDFTPFGVGESEAFNIILGYLVGESNRIFKYGLNKEALENYKGYNRKVTRKNKSKTQTDAGNAYTAFDDILTEDTQTELYNIIDKAVNEKNTDFDMMDVLNINFELREKIEQDVAEYFKSLTKENIKQLQKAQYVDTGLKERVPGFDRLTNDQVNETLMKAYTYNSWMHKFETSVLLYGDLAQYNHAKEEFHKRNAGFGSGGRSFSGDSKMLAFVNSLPNYYADRFGFKSRAFDGTLKTAILKERIVDESIYYKEYYDAVYQDYYSRLKDEKKAKELTEVALKGYRGMEIGDGQGHITFEAYRKLKNLEGSWLPEQEELFKKISMGEEVSPADVVQFFPPYKLQYTGAIKSEYLPVTSFHKFSLNPIIPGVAKQGTPLYDLHMKMMDNQMDYVVYGTGSKIGHIGKGDEIFDAEGNIIPDSKFTVNTIYTEFLKNQTEINSEFKGKSIFSTQMRKLILDNLFENGKITSKAAEPIVNKYLKDVTAYTELVKLKLLEEIGYDEVSEGKYEPRDKDSVSKLLGLIRANLEREDAYGNELIDFIDAVDSGELAIDLSYHPEVLKIEKVLLSMINKRIIKQKIKGEPLVQVSSAMFENNISGIGDFRNATEAEKKKWRGSNVLPTYHKKLIDLTARYQDLSKTELENALQAKLKIQKENSAYWTDSHKQSLRDEISHIQDRIAGKKPRITTTSDGKTAAMKVMIALQGDYTNLLNLEYKGETIETIERLNQAIKDDEWLDANDGANRKAITLVGVRIPVQGLNSMEFMEVYEFLPPQAGNIIIPPAEIVAKSGGDFDIDKLTIFMTNIDQDGKLVEGNYLSIDEIKNAVKEKIAAGESLDELFKVEMAGLENELIKDIKAILELPENFVSLITPNGTFLLKDTADMLSQYVMEYNPYATRMTEAKEKEISPTRVLETMYNLYKHESNIVGKATLGLGAIENTFNILLNSIGASLPNSYISETTKENRVRNTTLALRHKKMKVGDEERISLSNIYDVDNVNKVADVFSQAMNGWVDVEKDAWIFFIQGNYEVAPVLLFLVKAGVPVKEAIYFVSQPLVRKYVEQQRLIGSTFAPMLGKAVDGQGLIKSTAMKNIINEYYPNSLVPTNADKHKILDTADALLEKAFEKRENKNFTESEMLKLIEETSKDSTKASSNLSLVMFLHYLKIEDQIKGLTKVKMNANPDTNTRSTLTNIEISEDTLNSLVNDEYLSDLITGLMEDSVISSFFNGPLAIALSKPLFKLRYNKFFSDYIISLKQTRLLDKYVRETYGDGNEKLYINNFRNDFVSYIFQNALLKSKLGDSYMSYDMKETLDIKNFESKYFGAYVKTNNDGTKTLFVNDDILKLQFKNKDWSTDITDANSPYVVLGLHQVDPMTFATIEKDLNYDQYKRFVIEREYLRSIFPKEESQSKEEYEKFLAERALDNTFNFHHLFNNPDTAFANRVSKLIVEHPLLTKKFDVLSVLKSETNLNQNIFNLGIADRDINSTKANMYTSNLKDLANPVVLKTFAKELKLNDADIKKITETFSMLPFFAYLQSGINKSSYNLVPFVDYTNVVKVIEDGAGKILDLFNDASENFNSFEKGLYLLSDYLDKFQQANNKVTNPNKKEFKNYATNFDVDAIKIAAQPEVRKSQADVILPIGTSGSGKSTFIKTLPQENLVVIEPDAMRVEFTGDINNKSKDKEIYIEAANRAIKAIKEGKQVVFDTTNLTKDKRRPFIEAIKKAIPNANIQYKLMPLNPELAKKRIKADIAAGKNRANVSDETIDRHAKSYKQMLEDIKSEGIFDYDAQPQAITKTETIATPLGLVTIDSGLIETNNPNLFLYDSTQTKPDYYKNLVSKNSKVIYLHSFSNSEYDADMNKNFTKQSIMQLYAGDMSVPLITTIGKDDNLNGLSVEDKEQIKNYWSTVLTQVANLVEKGAVIALPTEGFGDSKLMPQDLFVYLSRELYEKLRYLNPGSLLHQEINNLVVSKQGVSDEEILQTYGFESDPFKCS